MAATVRILRAFAWLRWRVLMNSFERHGGRDAIERFSVAFEQITPILVLLLMVPTALLLAAAGSYSGWQLAHGELRVFTFEMLRFALLAGCVFAVVAPIVLPGGDRTNVARMLLLPIPRSLLYAAYATAAAMDPWMMLVTAVVLSVPIGLALGGALSAVPLALAAGIAVLVVLSGVTLLTTTLIQLAVRDRRRGEILGLIFIVVLPMIGILPSVMQGERRQGGAAAPRAATEPGAWAKAGRTAFSLVPSEVYARTVRAAAGRDGGAGGAAGLFGASAVLHAMAFVMFVRMLASPVTLTGGTTRTRWESRLPGMSSATSAIALAQLKLGLRTPRGRSTILSPIVLFLLFAAVMIRSGTGQFGFISLESGVGLATFTGFVALLSVAPLAMNQFAIDGAGLTLTFLAPVETRALLRGKAIGNGLLAAIPASICLLGAMVVKPGGDPALWASVPLALAATYLLVAPAAATLSAIFPKAVDMNTIGRSNPHGTASFVGTLAFMAAGAPCLLLVLLASRVLQRPEYAPLFLLLWLGLCAAASALLFEAVSALFDRRRENLAMVR